MSAIEDAYRRFSTERFPLPDEKQVADLEQRIGITFPPEYRRFLLQYNGGWFSEPSIAPPSDDCPRDRLTSLNGINAIHSSAELATPASLALFDDNDPPQVVPIGYTLMGNLILMLTTPDPEEFGVIMLKIAFSDRYHFLAENIEVFFGLLREPED